MDLRFRRLSSLTRGALHLLLLARLVLLSHTESMPSFIKSPDDQTGISGGVASFVCQAVGEPKPRITWMKKGKKVSSQRFEVIEFDDGSGSVLRIQPLRTHRDEAIYECTATNSVGEINTSAKLTVLDEDQIPHGFPTIDMGPQLKVVERTRTATMLCAASGNPDPEIYWFKDFLPVDINSSNGRIKQLRSGGTPIRGALQIENSEESDQGKYECVAVNSAGTRYSAPANLYVRVRRVPPRFSIPPTNHEVMPGGSVNLTCVAVGAPMPYVKWMTGELELTREEEMPIGRNVLELTNIRQSANYTCVAISSLGMIETTAQIIVKALPKPPTSLIVTETTATSVTLTWDSGNPEPVSYYVIQYRAKLSDNGFQEVDGVATTRYSIGGLSPFSEYEFRVMAVNNVGRGPPSGIVDTRTSEQAPSSPPLHVQARMLSSSTMLVQWEPPEEPNGQIRGYRIYYSSLHDAPLSAWQKHNTDDSQLTTISGLTTDITYSLRVLAFTSVGDGPPSDVLQIKTQQGVPAQPSGFEAEAELDSRIMLSWLWPVQEPIIGFELLYWEANNPTDKHHVTFDPAGSYAVDGLKPDTVYMFSLAARSDMGLGVFTQPIEARTAQSTPSAPPQEVHLLSLTSTSIKVSWVAPPTDSRHGEIVRYSLAYQALTGEDMERHQVSGIGADVTSYVLEDLEKWTEYMVWVRAHTDVGPGPESPAARIRTKEDVPGAPPRKVEVDAVNSTALRVTWKPPLSVKQHGQIRGYQLVYSRLENGEPHGQPVIVDVSLPEAQEAIITGLLPETTYSLTVAAYTTKGDGARSKAKVVTTTGAVPGKPTMMISTTIGNTALIQWQPPKEMVGEHVGYQLQFKRAEEEAYTIKDFRKTDDHFTVTGLYKGATYIFKLCAKNRAGNGEEYVKEISTPEDIPSSYPQNLSVVGLTATSTQLAWDPPPLAERNGKIVKYIVVYRDINSQHNNTNSTTETQMTVQGLQPDTTYDIRVQAFTSKGGGPISPSIQSRTMSTSMPDLPPVFTKNFGVKAVTKTSVLLTWEVPETYKSQVPLKILYNQQSLEVQGNLKRKLITQLQPDTEYSFVLMSRGNSAGGLQQQVSIRTAPDLLKMRPVQYQHDVEEGGRVTISLPRVPAGASVRWYYIVVVPVTPASLSRWENPEDMDIHELLEAGADSSLQRKRRQSQDFLQPYIAAKLDALPEIFTLGDEKKYNGYYNKPLPGQQHYRCFVLADLTDHESQRTFAASPFSEPIKVKLYSGMTRQTEDPEMLWVMGPVLAVILIIIIVIAILLFKRKRTSPAKDEHMAGVKDSLLAHSSDPVELRRLNYQTQGSSALSCLNTPRMREHPPIAISDLADHIERLRANDGLRFSQEYESVDPGQQFTWEHSNLEVNKPKNRYANVIAYDHSRVILTPVDGVPGSDYINGNYIDGYRKQNAYIATQGPLPETLSDFWRMVWEQRTCTIVMMTRLEEKSRVKCDQYWPSRGTETFGMIQVTMLDTVELATYNVRTFALYKNGSSEKREVRQFQFMAWPDHGVPEYPTPTLAFLRRVKACNPPDAGPMVVHCSAGVGRTGCFIVIEAMLERMKHEKTVDIYGHVTCMRAQRNYMVQTEDQYIFIHEALLEAATCGNTEVPARNLYAHIQKLTQIPPGETVTAMELEFKKLANSKAHTSRFISANLPCNKFKNRLVNIMPFESTRVCLQPIRGVEGSDYINASFIDGYRQQKAYMATQGPLAETTEDFWRMLWEHNSTIVVMLTKLREMGREKCHQYWPAERSARYQYFVVDPMAEYNMPQYILREFKVTDARDGQSRTIRQFQFTDWPEQGVPKTGEGFIDFIGQVHKTKEQFGQDGPITVHCSAGVGRTGVFITLSIVLERMRYEGVVDLFQTVKMLRTQRPAMVQTEDQYQLCYRAALEYLGSFDHYAT
ncbi:receptor-type tyrosine-protein phosphatase F isoform X1 [Lates calcarifer]|uniref:Receptor-type tyrosine-protein phosphatase F n=1 Tax=Lates calcarifer TaxID=8187 RepID=A0AAJ8BHI4_LATCA|nr:receptor-type tyrosine-protein phosphatase F isoform X1 [Lates calcarifer]XP_050933151.1 receptor-type tyrosine-protein phosphatase F isoform X1 [Lates calcarifer]XP_050933153.1 receptor-type tyrosine-protein phosphatase F isoform X1 [Lates calcarifer]XP_050933154.1 receptor-type tyrosine-protein phosphatase F isoform X1 [Lates calcarifer]XP_050933155.1 receptor-type tyrosine-protein phosphatase F isoform X1 [Lates calcarifer]